MSMEARAIALNRFGKHTTTRDALNLEYNNGQWILLVQRGKPTIDFN